MRHGVKNAAKKIKAEKTYKTFLNKNPSFIEKNISLRT